tara:strand:+ start:29 stop:1090 length:1062 start_codon:yes stop_codon:yes gene_type:complete
MKFSLKPENKIEIIVYICLLIVLIGMNFVPKDVLNMFNTMPGKIISLCVIIYLGTINLRIAILAAFVYLLLIARSRKELDKENFDSSTSQFSHHSDEQIMQYGDDVDSPYANWQTTNYSDGDIPSSSNYCVPAGTEGCKDPYVPAQNDPAWCAIPNQQGGAVRCIQKCPPTACTQKNKINNSSGIYGESIGADGSALTVTSECPPGQVTSEDDPDYCCKPKQGETSCFCNPCKTDFGCPKYTACNPQPCPEEEEQCPYILVKQYKCPQPEVESEMSTTPQPEGCPPVPSCPTPARGHDGEKRNTRTTPTQLPWLQKLGVNTTDPYLKQANTTLFNRTHPMPYQKSYDGFNIQQ